MKRLLTIRNLMILLLIAAMFVVWALVPQMKIASPVVSLAAEKLFDIGPLAVTNSMLTAWIVMLLLIVLAYFATRRIPKALDQASSQELVPSGLQNVLEWLVEGMHNITQGIAGSWTPKFFPIVATIFLFVLTSNWLGLIPGVGSIGILEHPHKAGQVGFVTQGRILTAEQVTVDAAHDAEAPAAEGEAHNPGFILVPLFRAPSTDLNFTIALALIAVGLTQYFGASALKGAYFKKFFDLSGFKKGAFDGIIGIFVGALDFVSEIAKILSFGFRLFGNIFAGEVLLGVMAFLIPYIASLPFYGLEVFVGFIQAAVFMMLSLVFFTTATVGHGSEAHH